MNYHCVNKNESKHLRIKKRDICLVLQKIFKILILGIFMVSLWVTCGDSVGYRQSVSLGRVLKLNGI